MILYGISFIASLLGFFGVGHLFAGAPTKAVAYFVAGAIWTVASFVLGVSTGFSAYICFLPMHLLFAHFCAADAVRIAKGQA